MPNMIRVLYDHKTWSMKLVGKTFDLNRVRNKLLDNDISFTNLNCNDYSFWFDCTKDMADKVDYHFWHGKKYDKSFGHRYLYFHSGSRRDLTKYPIGKAA